MNRIVRDLFEKTGAGFVALACVLILGHQIWDSKLEGRAADPVGKEVRLYGGFMPRRRASGAHLIARESAAVPNLIAAAVKLPAIEYFDLSSSRDVHGKLAVLRLMRNVDTLVLSRTNVGDADLLHVARMVNLKRLILDETAVTAAGLATVAAMPGLEDLVVRGVTLTDAELARLKASTKAKISR